ncbi:PAS domain S-box protein [Mycobacterium parascrofulaceum ATCC BAA-614]|uniref:histidine kinase n=2 Tax=Mycobacterium parascrofulaceum TaxID=240125 RepID=D5P333_9MYCO|nr:MULTISPECIES: PAS and ANTAR domain-containing protein [Mycobacterium]EFG79511.1 PAS domain S-box protein [Mycobacterium parascrofulaceum ATCC BAA-614]OCB58901.1 antitermination regulator [Mycobacterium malmoense]
MTVNFEGEAVGRRDDDSAHDESSEASKAMMADVEAEERSAVDLVLGLGDPQKVGRFEFFMESERWEWSDAVARMHGYRPGEVRPSTDLLLQHKHPEDRGHVAAVLDQILRGKPFSSRHRIIDTAGRTRCVVVVGDRMLDDDGELIGTSGFYVDVTDSLQSDINNVLSAVADARASIEQAKGVLMAAYGISARRAFDILVWRSQETNLKLRDLAGRFLDAVASTASAETRSEVDRALLALE